MTTMTDNQMDDPRINAVDETIESLHAALAAFGFTQTGRAEIDGSSLYGVRSENGAPRRYIGRVFDPSSCNLDVERWFEANGPTLPE